MIEFPLYASTELSMFFLLSLLFIVLTIVMVVFIPFQHQWFISTTKYDLLRERTTWMICGKKKKTKSLPLGNKTGKKLCDKNAMNNLFENETNFDTIKLFVITFLIKHNFRTEPTIRRLTPLLIETFNVQLG